MHRIEVERGGEGRAVGRAEGRGGGKREGKQAARWVGKLSWLSCVIDHGKWRC